MLGGASHPSKAGLARPGRTLAVCLVLGVLATPFADRAAAQIVIGDGGSGSVTVDYGVLDSLGSPNRNSVPWPPPNSQLPNVSAPPAGTTVTPAPLTSAPQVTSTPEPLARPSPAPSESAGPVVTRPTTPQTVQPPPPSPPRPATPDVEPPALESQVVQPTAPEPPPEPPPTPEPPPAPAPAPAPEPPLASEPASAPEAEPAPETASAPPPQPSAPFTPARPQDRPDPPQTAAVPEEPQAEPAPAPEPAPEPSPQSAPTPPPSPGSGSDDGEVASLPPPQPPSTPSQPAAPPADGQDLTVPPVLNDGGQPEQTDLPPTVEQDPGPLPQGPPNNQTGQPAPGESVAQLPASAGYRILFDASSDQLTTAAGSLLNGLAERMNNDEALRVQIRAYASGSAAEASNARRLSLNRALVVRSFLIDRGVRPTRIDIRALGNTAEQTPLDRVDLIFSN